MSEAAFCDVKNKADCEEAALICSRHLYSSVISLEKALDSQLNLIPPPNFFEALDLFCFSIWLL